MVTLWHVLGPRAWLRSTIEREMQMQRFMPLYVILSHHSAQPWSMTIIYLPRYLGR
jgi:hypothetical protein